MRQRDGLAKLLRSMQIIRMRDELQIESRIRIRKSLFVPSPRLDGLDRDEVGIREEQVQGKLISSRVHLFSLSS